LKNLNINEVINFKKIPDQSASFPETKTITNERLLKLGVDILALVALENVITKKNTGQIKAKLILKLVNNPVIIFEKRKDAIMLICAWRLIFRGWKE